MEIVIDIDDNIYTRLFDNGIDDYDDPIDIATVIHDTMDIKTAIRKGTPLPEHHGRLIDADALKNKIIYKDDVADETWDELYDSVLEEIDNAPTIIEGARRMPHSLKSKVKSLCYKGEITEKERDRLLEALESQPCEDCISILNRIMEYTYGMLTTEKFGLQHLIKSMMDDLPSVTPQQTRWIPVSERLPEEDGFYLATCDGEICGEDEPFSGLAEFENGKWTDDEEGYQCVLAWMPLPQPYNAEREGEEC